MIFTASVNRTNSEILKPHLFLIQNLLHYYRSKPVCLPPHAQIIQHLQLNKIIFFFFYQNHWQILRNFLFVLCSQHLYNSLFASVPVRKTDQQKAQRCERSLWQIHLWVLQLYPTYNMYMDALRCAMIWCNALAKAVNGSIRNLQ